MVKIGWSRMSAKAKKCSIRDRRFFSSSEKSPPALSPPAPSKSKRFYWDQAAGGSESSLLLHFFAFALILVLFVPEASACPTCSDIVARGKDAVKVMRFGNGISWSILLMLSIPYLLIGSFAFIFWRKLKKKQASKTEDVPS